MIKLLLHPFIGTLQFANPHIKSTGMRCENMDEEAIISSKLTVTNIQEMVALPK